MTIQSKTSEPQHCNSRYPLLMNTPIALFCQLAFATLLWVVPANGFAQDKKVPTNLANGYQASNESQADYLSRNGLTVYAGAATKWNDEIANLAAQNIKTNDPQSILFLGSSTIRLWDNLKEDVAPYTTIKRGYGGAKFCDLAIHCPQLIDGLKFRAAVVFVANDITGSVADKEPAEIKRLAKIVIASLKKNNPLSPVILLSITATPSRFNHWKRIQAANRALSTISDEIADVYFLETEDSYLTEDGKPIEEYFVDDRLHQTPAGYQLLGKLVRTKLNEVLALPPKPKSL